MSDEIGTVFSKLELECRLEKENSQLKEKIKQLEQENTLFKQKELSKTKLNMNAECVCIYTTSTSTTIYGDSAQIDKLQSNCADLKYTKVDADTWGSRIQFTSITSAKTCLLRNGYVYSHDSKTSDRPYYVENWFKGI